MITANIQKQIVEAMKARDSVRMGTLKLLSAELHNEAIAKQHDLSEEEEMAVVKREVKKRKDSIESYEKAARQDLADAEKAELVILQEFMPPEMDDGELEKIVAETISEIGATSMADMGKVMSAVMGKTGGQADGAKVSTLVRTKLSS